MTSRSHHPIPLLYGFLSLAQIYLRVGCLGLPPFPPRVRAALAGGVDTLRGLPIRKSLPLVNVQISTRVLKNIDTSRSSPPLYKAVNRPVRGTEQPGAAGLPRGFLVTAPERHRTGGSREAAVPASAERQLSPLTTESYVEMWWG